MKKTLFALAFIAVSLVSCEKDDVKTNDPKAVETTKVAFNVGTDNKVSETGKLVNRGSIPLYVDNLTINATCTGYGVPTVATETFQFQGAVTSSPSPLTLGTVALGNNTFNATSTSAAANKVLSLGAVASPSSGDVLDAMKAHVPFIPCFSTNNPSAVIIKGTNAPVNLIMGTNHGRVLAKFVQESPLADNYRVVVNTSIAGQPAKEANIVGSSGNVLAFEWSNEACTEGAVVTFTIRIFEKSDGNTAGALLNTLTKTITVQKAKNIMATYTIKNTDVQTDITEGGILIQFPAITDVIISD